MKLFLIRHGETTANVDHVYSGQQNVLLTERGREQACAIRPILSQFRFNKVYTSDLYRALDTQQFAIPGVEPIRLPILREFDVGTLAGLPHQNVKDYTEFGGESKEAVCQRCRELLTMLETRSYEYVAAFTHGGFMKCMLQVVMGTDYQRGLVACSNCCIVVLEYTGGTWRVLSWNYGGKL